MKDHSVILRIEIDDILNQRLESLVTHHGHKGYIIRKAIEKEVGRREDEIESMKLSGIVGKVEE